MLGVESIGFHASKHSSFIRGIGRDVEFLGYPLPLPHGLSFGASRKAVTAALGKPTRGDQYGEGGEVYWLDRWKRVGKYPLCAEFVDDKLVMVEIGQPLP